jgi:DNA-directed RNA polymerase subunit beta
MVQSVASMSNAVRTSRKSYARTPNVVELPRLIEIQLNSFEWFRTEGLKELFEEISPIVSFNPKTNAGSGTSHSRLPCG